MDSLQLLPNQVSPYLIKDQISLHLLWFLV